ncbi:ABC transporter ATP-binding protein [Paenibacillus sp. SC116]|uniref:ABC transporter ATP-binding protein n=1 Tax=Paenibacillus sp. SC116 TaxID=2968986 RepID=UPI00215AA5B6|nr:ABC transporter ATP-binding protein [Paenibacillus sp. SC116]MCR8843342.1 ABC transporter ATP-binding protein [Paenibacillus sp. SC116]
MLTIDHVHKHYDGSHVLKGITLTVPRGQSILFRGDNGSGKSTLLRMICGLLRPTSGRIQWMDDLEKEYQRTIGYVPERFPQLNMSPYEYLLAMGRIQGMSDRDIQGRMEELLGLFRMESYRNQRMNGFSKGMLQKLNLVQAMLRKPDLLVLDEPLSGLDVDAQRKLQQLLMEMHREGTALMMVCHESDLLDGVAERIITLDKGLVLGDELLDVDERDSVLVERKMKLRSAESACTRIVCCRVSEELQRVLDAHEAVTVLELESYKEEADMKAGCVTHCISVNVPSSSSDDVLRLILAAGGSVVSVQQLSVVCTENEEGTICASH